MRCPRPPRASCSVSRFATWIVEAAFKAPQSGSIALIPRGNSMRTPILSLLVAGQIAVAAQPALAAELEPGEQTRAGLFGGMQVRLPLGGGMRAQRPSIALGIAPTMHSQRLDG